MRIKVEAMLRIEGAMGSVSVKLAGPGLGEEAVPYSVGRRKHGYSLLLKAFVIKKAELHLCGVGGINGKIYAVPDPGSAQTGGLARQGLEMICFIRE
jgi:hypothetical protein